MFFRPRMQSFWMCVVLASLLLIPAVSAQEPTPIIINTNTFGDFTQARQSIEFALTIAEPQVSLVQVLSITDGVVASFAVFNPDGVIIAAVPNNGTQPLVTANIALSLAGTYRIVVQSEADTTGQFLLTVQRIGALIPPQTLTINQQVSDEIDGQTTLRAYVFTSITEPQIIAVWAIQPDFAPIVTLRNADTNTLLAISSAQVTGVRYWLAPPIVLTNYRLEISYSGSGVLQPFTVCLASASNAALCNLETGTADSGALTPVASASEEPIQIPADGACQVATSARGTVNIREGPGLDFAVVSTLRSTVTIPVIGRLADNSWYQVNNGGLLGWVSTNVIRIGGQCGGVAIVVPPTAIPLTTTLTFTPTPTSTGATATTGPTSTASVTFTATATVTPTAGAVATLNFSLPPTYGSTALISGFVPDPFAVGITAGGPANVSYLGSGCVGYTTSAPAFSVNYTSGAFPILRFYFIGGGDTTMVINTPGGSYACGDDSFGTLNPTLDFNSPSGGRYDIWIGTFASGGSVSGTLYVTENTGNHP